MFVVGLSWADINTGEFFTSDTTTDSFFSEFSQISPVEVIVDARCKTWDHPVIKLLSNLNNMDLDFTTSVSFLDSAHVFDTSRTKELLRAHMESNQSKDMFELGSIHREALGIMLAFLDESFNGNKHLLRVPVLIESSQIMKLDQAAMKALELTSTMYKGKRKGSLINTMDQTATSHGSRLLQSRLSNNFLFF